MARTLRIEYPGAIYHVTCRLVGSWRDGDRELFRDDADRWRFMDSLATRVDAFGVVLHQYVLMQNHTHLVIETPRGNCSAFMQSLLTSYTVYFNLRHDRHGHLFDGRYKAKLVEGDAYLLGLSRYVHLNPVRVGALKDSPEEARKHLRTYYWSSYLQYVGRRKRLEFVTYTPTLAQMHKPARDRPRRYRQFVENGLGEVDEELKCAMSVSRLGIGGEAFRDEMQGLYAELVAGTSRPEDAALRNVVEVLTADPRCWRSWRNAWDASRGCLPNVPRARCIAPLRRAISRVTLLYRSVMWPLSSGSAQVRPSACSYAGSRPWSQTAASCEVWRRSVTRPYRR
jgi:putative transposase